MADQLIPDLTPVLDANGDPVSGGTVTFQETGTTTNVSIFSDSAGSSALANPLTLDAGGRPPTQVFYTGSTGVKAVIKDSSGATVRTVDPIPRVSISGSAASSITFTPITGNPATNVQDAIENVPQTINDILPPGIILMWSGSVATIPDGWALCNGSAGTPDLRNRFIMGAGDTYAPGATGGAASIDSVPEHSHASGSLATSSAGAHSHSASTGSAGSHTHDIFQETVTRADGAVGTGHLVRSSSSDHTSQTQSAGSHTHSVTIDSGGAHTHSISGSTANTGSASVSVLNPYYALAFIMKISV